MFTNHIVLLVSTLLFLIHFVGVVTAGHAVMHVRTSQGTIAWVMVLIIFPYVSLPLYLIFGRTRFDAYAEAHRLALVKVQTLMQDIYTQIGHHEMALLPAIESLQRIGKALTGLSFTTANSVKLLINGETIFASMLAAIRQAKDYILVQFYIVRDDAMGQALKQALIERAQAKVKIYFIYDEIGSYHLSKEYISELRQHRIQVTKFHSTRKGRWHRFQINFRNHRKILLIDGITAFLGGINIGDEYLGRNRRLGAWRDTCVLLQGPSVQCLQLSFINDWFWAEGNFPTLHWQITPDFHANKKIMILPSGPADDLASAMYLLLEVINQASTRLWLASPYFVPDGSILNALQLAALRGVDVRSLLPDRANYLLVYLCSYSYYQELRKV